VEGHTLRNHALEGVVADLFGRLDEGDKLLVVLNELSVTHLSDYLVARLLGAFLSRAKY
jgi:hypothetical protein